MGKYISKKNRKTLLLIVVPILIIMLIECVFFKPTKINYYVASKIYKSPANNAFVDDNFYKCVVDTYNSNNKASVAYTESLTDDQLNSITYLRCDGGNITNASGLEKMESLALLYILNNQLTSIDLSHNPALRGLFVNGNQITSIDLSHNPELRTIEAYNNQLTNMDVSHNPKLESLTAYRNQLTSLDLSHNSALKSLNIGTNQLTQLDLSYATSLNELTVHSNQLASLDISHNPKLESLTAYNNKITSLDASNNPDLYYITIWNNAVADLDLSHNPALEVLSIYNNQLTSIDLSHNPKLYTLYVNGNKLTSLDLSNNQNLINLNAKENLIESLDLSHNSKLKTIDVSVNQLTSLNINYNTVLEELYASKNQLTGIYLENSLNLSYLDISINNLTSIDLSQNTALKTLYAYNNQLTSLDLSHNSALETLSANANQLTVLDLSQNTALKSLAISNNRLTSIDLSHNPALTSLFLSNNQLTSLNVGQNAELAALYAYDNQLTSLNVSNNPKLVLIEVYNNKLTSLDFSGAESLKTLRAYNNQLTNIDLSHNLDLYLMDISENQLTSLDLSNNYNLDTSNVTLDNAFSFNGVSYLNADYIFDEDYLQLPGNEKAEFLGVYTEIDGISYNIPNFTGKFELTVLYRCKIKNKYFSFTNTFNMDVIEITSDEYLIDNSDSFIFVGSESIDEEIKEKINVPDLVDLYIDSTNNKLQVLNSQKILKEFDLVSIHSNEYDLSKDYIYTSIMEFDIDKINVINGTKEIYNKYLRIKRGNKLIKRFNLLRIVSKSCYLGEGYIYTSTNTLSINLENSNGKASFNFGDNILEVSYDNNLLESLVIKRLKINNYRRLNHLIIIPNLDISYESFISNIETNGVTYKIYDGNNEVSSGQIKRNMVLKVYNDETLLEEFTITDEYLEFDESLNVNEDENYIYKIKEGTKVSDLLSKINTSGEVTIKNNSGKELNDSDIIGTGYKITIELSSRTIEYTLIVSGDVTGDGVVNIADVVKIADHTITRDILSSFEQIAAEVTSDETLNIADVVKIADYTLDKSIEIWR